MDQPEPTVPESLPEAAPRKRRRRFRLYVGLIAVLLLGVGAYVGIEIYRGPALHATTPPPAAAGLTPDETAYYDYVAPRMHQLIAELRLLADMGSQKSRNIIVLERHYTSASNLIDEIQAYQAQHPLPSRFAPAATPLAAGIAQVQTAMSNAQSAFFKLQFDKLGELLKEFNGGADTVNQAVMLLDELGGATPPALGSATP